jgi:hypothetical protein
MQHIFFKKNKPFFPLYLLLLYCITTIIYAAVIYKIEFGVTQYFEFTLKHYSAAGALLIVGISILLIRKLYPFLLAITIVAGIINWIEFLPIIFSLKFELNGIGITFNLFPLIAGAVFLICFSKQIRELVSSKAKEDSNMPDFYNIFLERYKNYTDEELRTIAVSEKHKSEARAAAKDILKQRELQA